MKTAVKKVDVLVVGLGPAGGSAALKASQAGLTVMAVEKKREVGKPVQCAEFVPLPMSAYAAESPVRIQTVAGMQSFLPSGLVEKTEFPGIMIDRQQFDESIADKAKQAGTEIHTGAQLVGLDLAENIAEIRQGEKSFCVEYRSLIAADGPHSRVARIIGFPELDTVNTRQYTVRLNRKYTDTDIWLSDEYPGGYAWLFPKGEWANLGLGANKDFEEDLKAPLDRLHKKLVAKGLLGEDIVYRTGGLIPVGGLRDKIFIGNVVFVGDAAGLTHPITGAGISAAVMSGEMAGQSVVDWLNGDEEALTDYQEEIFDQFETTLKRAVKKREWLKTIWRTQAAEKDTAMRNGWIAFDEYFKDAENLNVH